jgi:hypothetical protein
MSEGLDQRLNEHLNDIITKGLAPMIKNLQEEIKELKEENEKLMEAGIWLETQIPDKKGKKLSQKDKEALEEILHNIEHPYGTEDHHNDGGGSFYEAKVNLLKRLMK